MRKVTTPPKIVLEEIAKRAPLAHAAHARQAAAYVSERAAEVQLVAAAIELARPALPSIVSRVPWLEGMAAAQLFEDLWLLENGTFAAMRRTEKIVVAATTITIAEACEIAAPGEILSGLAALLAGQIKGRTESAERAERTAATLKAIITLLGGA
jgi:hypothetical protein